ncbi:methyltransferase domain-containing protein [Nocardioides hwasunensis]|uniref:Class I SAM-dependent methyltransferase n=1 Tax=Nocardioides hwasunensis TaxID=397258 RepID=A0ABR8MJW5_9ACTN|nr:methyltransferase domain-containing protein [Nocardioides hwasunensis]MBD3914789.1 class I SAM-dependent methyltransferase [Nocardioides hwasunensis]
MSDQSFSEVFTDALHGRPTVVHGLDQEPTLLPMHLWRRPADADDLRLVDLCSGPTLDVGCGPGRMTEALAAAGHETLGIDVVEAAVHLTRQRGVSALRHDVFERVPSEGEWETALLADGNVGIGGDPVALLTRVSRLLAPGGRAVVELEGPGIAMRDGWAVLEGAAGRSRPFRWAHVGVDDVEHVAARAGLAVERVCPVGHRWVAVLTVATP